MWIGLEYFCEEGDSFWNMSDEEAKKFAIQELTRMQIINGPQDVLDSHRERVKKAYPAYFDTYDRMPELVEYLDSFGNLYCVRHRGRRQYQEWQDVQEERVVRQYRQELPRGKVSFGKSDILLLQAKTRRVITRRVFCIVICDLRLA